MQSHYLEFCSIIIDHQLIAVAIYHDKSFDAYVQPSLFKDFTYTGLFDGFARFESAAGQAALSIIGTARKEKLAFMIENDRGTSYTDFALFTYSWTIQDLCGHISSLL